AGPFFMPPDGGLPFPERKSQRASLRSVGQREAEFQRGLILGCAVPVDEAAHRDQFEPADIAERFPGAGQAVLDGVIGALAGCADDLDELIDMVLHRILSFFILERRLCLPHPTDKRDMAGFPALRRKARSYP